MAIGCGKLQELRARFKGWSHTVFVRVQTMAVRKFGRFVTTGVFGPSIPSQGSAVSCRDGGCPRYYMSCQCSTFVLPPLNSTSPQALRVGMPQCHIDRALRRQI